MSPGWLLVLTLLSPQRVHIGGAAIPANGIVAPEVLTYTDPSPWKDPSTPKER